MTHLLAPYIGVFQFSNGPYLIFLAAAVILYFLLPGPRRRVAWLLTLSAGFYLLLSPWSFWVLLAVSAVSYLTGLALESSSGIFGAASEESGRRAVLVTALCVLVGALITFKYLGFFAEIANAALAWGGLAVSAPVLRLALPLGISFWTFQTVAYVADVYSGKTSAERNPFYFLAAVMFFPVVTAGPITKVQTLVSRLTERHRFDYDGMQSALLLIGRGFFKKLVIADRLAVVVGTVFGQPHAYTPGRDSTILFVGAVCFAIQLYCDFSGYTDIVRGSARMFGVDLPINFSAPYLARSVRDFWRRWHITLMNWLRDYIYIPLGGNRVGRARRYANLLAVFAVSGLWHGAGVTYLIWGLLNGLYQIAGQLLAPLNDRLVRILRIDREAFVHRVFQTVVTFVLITIAWVFFRAETVSDAFYMVTRMFAPTPWVFVDGSLLKLGLSAAQIGVAFAGVIVVFGSEWLAQRVDLLEVLRGRHLVLRWAVYYALILAIVVFGAYGSIYKAADFVYFKY